MQTQENQPFGAGAKAPIKKIQASAVIQCAETGDMVATRVDRYNTYQGWRTDVLYWYVPANASDVSDLVKLDIAELASGFFVKPINPFTWDPIIPANKR